MRRPGNCGFPLPEQDPRGAITQLAGDTDGRTYYRRKRAAGKSHKEALRCLKRRMSDIVYRQLVHDATAVMACADNKEAALGSSATG